MDGLELFFKALLQKGLAKKGKKGEEVENKVKSDALSYCLYLLMIPGLSHYFCMEIQKPRCFKN